MKKKKKIKFEVNEFGKQNEQIDFTCPCCNKLLTMMLEGVMSFDRYYLIEKKNGDEK